MKGTAHKKTGFIAIVLLTVAVMIFTVLSTPAAAANQSKNKGFYDITKGFGGTGKGNVDDSGAILAAIREAEADKGTLYFPYGTYRISQNITVPESVTLSFDKGAKLVIDPGVTLTINSYEIDAGLYQIFDGEGRVDRIPNIPKAYPQWWGAVVNNGADDSAAIQEAVDACDVLEFTRGVYKIDSGIIIPQSRILSWSGAGFRQTFFRIAPDITAVEYQRPENTPGAVFTIDNMAFVQDGPATSTAIRFYGFGPAQDDNWLRMEQCYFLGLDKGVDLGYAGQCHFVANWSQGTNIAYNLTRGASFAYFERCMNLSGGSFIYASDPAGDGYSNGVTVNMCHSVWASATDIHFDGWQAVFINQGGFDLGLRKQGLEMDSNAAVYLRNCQDIRVTNCWLASWLGDAAGDPVLNKQRIGLHLKETHSGIVSGNSFVNNYIGVKVEGYDPNVEPWPAFGGKTINNALAVVGNKFQANTYYHIYLGDYSRTVSITQNTFQTNPRKSDDDRVHCEIYAETNGTDYNIIKDNMFAGPEYTIECGANSIVKDNIWNIGEDCFLSLIYDMYNKPGVPDTPMGQ